MSENTINLKFNFAVNVVKISALVFGLVILFWLFLLNLCNHVTYATFNTNLCTFRRKKHSYSPHCFSTFFSFFLVLLGLLFSEYPEYLFIQYIIRYNPNFASLVNLTHKHRKILSRIFPLILSIYIFSEATPGACILSILVFQFRVIKNGKSIEDKNKTVLLR